MGNTFPHLPNLSRWHWDPGRDGIPSPSRILQGLGRGPGRESDRVESSGREVRARLLAAECMPMFFSIPSPRAWGGLRWSLSCREGGLLHTPPHPVLYAPMGRGVCVWVHLRGRVCARGRHRGSVSL